MMRSFISYIRYLAESEKQKGIGTTKLPDNTLVIPCKSESDADDIMGIIGSKYGYKCRINTYEIHTGKSAYPGVHIYNVPKDKQDEVKKFLKDKSFLECDDLKDELYGPAWKKKLNESKNISLSEALTIQDNVFLNLGFTGDTKKGYSLPVGANAYIYRYDQSGHPVIEISDNKQGILIDGIEDVNEFMKNIKFVIDTLKKHNFSIAMGILRSKLHHITSDTW